MYRLTLRGDTVPTRREGGNVFRGPIGVDKIAASGRWPAGQRTIKRLRRWLRYSPSAATPPESARCKDGEPCQSNHGALDYGNSKC
jgi:hypothetical protein